MNPTILLSLVILSACVIKTENSASTTSLRDTPEGKAIEERLEQYYKDMSDRDWEKYRTHFWEHATITTAWQQPGEASATVHVTTIDDFIKTTPEGPDSQPVFEERIISSEIRTEGNIAGAWVDYEAKFGKTDSLMQWKGKDVFTFLRHNGEWRIVSLVFESK